MAAEQIGFFFAPFLSGAALCTTLIIIRNRSVTMSRRKKTKISMARLPTPEIDFDDDEATDAIAQKSAKVAASEPDVIATIEIPSPKTAPQIDVIATVAEPPPIKKSDPVAPPASVANLRETKTVPAVQSVEIDEPAQPVYTPTVKTIKEPVSPPLPFSKNKESADSVVRRKLPETVKMKARKVLLAEDVEFNRELITSYFEGTGVKFDFAENGEEACKKFEEDPNSYSLILMDIQMPVMDGYEAAKRIRANSDEWSKQIPIIAMTADIFKENIDACFDAGMDDHIAKPLDMDELMDKVFEFITMNEQA